MILHNRKLGQKKIQNKTGPIAKKERKKKKMKAIPGSRLAVI